MEIERIISGGQTGADRGAFDAAFGFGIEVGGWVPRGRLDENGLVPGRYPNLVEAGTDNPADRTELNVRGSDATLILSHGPLMGGSEFTRKCAVELGKPWKHINLAEATTSAVVADIMGWLSQVKPRVLNVAGPRASEDPRIYGATKTIMEGVFMNQNLDILVGLRASVLSECCHWDQIRWQVPAWFCTLATVGIAVVGRMCVDTPAEVAFSAALGIFGSLCFILLCRLVTYERQAVSKFNGKLDDLLPGHALRPILKIERPIDFTGARRLLTTTFWFALYTAALALSSLGWAAWLRWHRIAPVIGAIVIAVVFGIIVLVVLPRILPAKIDTSADAGGEHSTRLGNE